MKCGHRESRHGKVRYVSDYKKGKIPPNVKKKCNCKVRR